MADFKKTRDNLRQARDAKQQTRRELFEAQEALKKLKAEETELARVFNPNDPQHLERRQQLETLRADAEDTIKQRSATLGQVKDAELGSFKDFAVFTDPRQHIEQCSEQFPFLLMPVRLETRFKSVTGDNSTQQQLWVRIYPDECAVDNFEAELSETEVASARSYWGEIWRAGKSEDGARGAWRALVASHGAGRAAWIVQTYLPVNADQQPKKANPDDIILVILTDTALGDAEDTAVAAFWHAMWLAEGDKSKEDDAREALIAAVVDEARADELIAQYKPINLNETPRAPLKKTDVVAEVKTVVFPPPAEQPTKTQSWSQASKVNVLPDRFVLIGYSGGKVAFEVLGHQIPSPLIVGPDPSAAPADQLQQKDGELVIPEEIRWMVDFERAIEVGMGVKINLTDAQARGGFDRLLALGIRLSADEQSGKVLLEELFQHHQYGPNGFSLLPQGTPTNNTENAGSGFSRSVDADASFDDIFIDKDADLLVKPEEWAKKRDGQWLAEHLGIDDSALKDVRHSDGTDQSEARAMNVALWPATLGYMMETMMEPVFEDQTIEQTRWFFNNFVSGRGAIPAIRIGNQPYGILPTTAFSRMNWLTAERLPPIPGLEHPRNHAVYLRRLYALLGKMDADWATLSKQVSFVGKPPGANSDAHKILLDIIGLHSGSVEFYQRYAESLAHIFNLFNLSGFGGALIAALIAAGYVKSGTDLLTKLGYTGETAPDILNKFFMTAQNLLKGPVVDDRPLSETESIRKYTDEADEGQRRNYLQWLIDAARTSLETIRQEKGFKDNKSPTALLYLLLRHALILGYWDTSLRLHRAAAIELPSTLKREPSFIHVSERAETSESRWSYLYKAEPRITNSQSQLVADFIPQLVFHSPHARYLSEQISALERLKDVPTARLERVFAEHIDTCSYRLDAWRLGLVHYQLAAMRYRREDEGENEVASAKGLYLGAYGWLEEVRPENKVLTPQQLDPELNEIFNKTDDPPLMRDNTNYGYVHAPSLNHAVTAAVLRNGYQSNATPANPQTLAVNLSSERVRRALSILEGIRGGQSLGALLGYQFERGLHDRHNQAEVDQFIFSLRKEFPLRANRLTTTKRDEADVSIEAIEARNVLDGVRLVEHIKKTNILTYPFGKSLPSASTAQAAAINAEVNRLLDTHDAVADLALAEGVHQAVQGNYDRASSTLETYSKGNFPPEPDVVRTPRSGIALTHRIGLQLETGLAPAGTPRAQAEPALNKWLAAVLPALTDVFCQVVYFDPVANAQTSHDVTLQALQLQPIDVLYLLRTESQQAMAELDDRIVRHVINTFNPRPDAALKIKYLGKPASKISMFELAPLIASLRSLVLRSRPLRASDIALQTESKQEQDEDVFVDPQRIVSVRTALEALATDFTNFNSAPANIDADIDKMAGLLSSASGFGIPQTGWGFLYDWKHLAFSDTMKKVDELTERWDALLKDYDALIVEYENLPGGTGNEEKFALLQRAERLISTSTTSTLPAMPDDFRDALDLNKRTPFETRLNDFTTQVLQINATSLNPLLTAVKALLPVSDFDQTGIELTDIEGRVVSFSAELNLRAEALAAETKKRWTAAQALLDTHATTAGASARAQLLETAAQTLLGEDFHLIPEFGLAPAQADEWEKALAASTSGDLLKHQTQTLNVDFPVDDWLYGIARVREKLTHWERVMMLARGFGKAEPELLPVQLPFKADDHWLGLEFPATYQNDGDRLLYTAHYGAPFQKSQRQCGLLLDEWTEVIPGAEETTGITFHYDRPNSEPPQVMLLVTPSTFDVAWQWKDLVDALNETLELAKKRAVEPVHVDATAYARFLPATVMAVTLYQISIAANLAVNNQVFAVMPGGDNG